MKKAGLQFLVSIIFFFGIWFGLYQVDWLTLMNAQETRDETAEELGNMLWESVRESEPVIYDPEIVNPVDSLLIRICEKNDIDRDQVKLHVIKEKQVNAFVLPDAHLVIHSGLINYCDNEEELCGVIGHELGHIEKDHVMKKLVKEVGLSMLIVTTSGNTGGNSMSRLLRIISSSAYDRELEKEADQAAVEYLSNAQIDPEPFANLLYRFGDETSAITEWISTHPNSKERAKSILEYIGSKSIDEKEILSKKQWKALQSKTESLESNSF